MIANATASSNIRQAATFFGIVVIRSASKLKLPLVTPIEGAFGPVKVSASFSL